MVIVNHSGAARHYSGKVGKGAYNQSTLWPHAGAPLAGSPVVPMIPGPGSGGLFKLAPPPADLVPVRGDLHVHAWSLLLSCVEKVLLIDLWGENLEHICFLRLQMPLCVLPCITNFLHKCIASVDNPTLKRRIGWC